MLSGVKSARSYDNKTMTWGNGTYPGRPIADRVSFECLPDGPPMDPKPFMFNTTCANGMRAQIHFQSCWDGVHLYKSDNTHVAYLSQIDDGVCPPGYPYVLPQLFLETNYAVSQVPDQQKGGQFVFSQGDPTGYGFHGDFQNGWDMDVQTDAVANCLVPDNFGQISYCPSLYASYTDGYTWNCAERPPQVGEAVHGMLDKLPGCINITYGPEAAPAASMTCPTSVPNPSITRTADSTPSATNQPRQFEYFGRPDEQYLGCFNDSQGRIRTLNAFSISNYTAMTVEFCQATCAANGYRLSGVEYAQECHCDNFLNPTAVNKSNACTWNCGGTMTTGGTQELCGGSGYINVYNLTDPDFNANGSEVNGAGQASPYTPSVPFLSNYLGCYSDDVTSRTLSGALTSANDMSWDVCATFCDSQGGFQHYGLEFQLQCYCGNTINAAAVLLNSTANPNAAQCDLRCAGAEPEICGGSGAITVYTNTSFVVPAARPKIGKYSTSVCLADPNIDGRALQGPSMTSNDLTDEACVKFCLGKYMHYAG